MRLLLLAAAALALAAAKPGTYKEKEDFQFSRSSSDDGTKSGYYGAQRGNMGGNYERAHNMDSLAQNQMSGLVKQVEGELGDGSKTRTGSVYTAANSGGVYGSGHYDLTNLAGRNFQDGVTYGNAQSHSSSMNSAYQQQSSSASKNAYNNQYQTSGRSGGYQGAGYTGQMQSSNLHAQVANNENRGSEYNYGQSADQRTGYYSQSGNYRQSAYDNANAESSFDHGSNVHTRLISATPVRVIVRPGTSVTIPVAAQTYDTLRSFSSGSQNSVNSEAEAIINANQQTTYQVTTKPKYYESSYKYHKSWEKHDTQPGGVPSAIPTSNSFPKNSELYEDTQAHKTDSQFDTIGVGTLNSHSSNAYNRYHANSAASSQSQYRTDYNSQLQGSSGSNLNSANGYNTHNSARTADSLNEIVGDLNSKPKGYQSSYSYHKSWERQGDPYVISPASDSGAYKGQASQKLTAASSNQGTYASHQYGSNYQQSQQRYVNNDASDCDDNGHIRVARSFDTQQAANFNENQLSQNIFDGQEELGQKTQNLEDLGQQSQTQWDNLEDLGQQTQNKWDQLQDVGQQAQNKWDQSEDLGQQTQQQWDNLEEAGQQTQNKWDNLEDLGQQSQKDLGQQTQDTWNNFDIRPKENDGQQTQDTWNNFDIRPKENDGQQTQTNWDNLSELNQQVQTTQDESQFSQTVTHIDPVNSHSFDDIETNIKPDTHQVQTLWDKIGSLDRNNNKNENVHQNVQVQTLWDKIGSLDRSYNNNENVQQNVQADTELDKNNWHQVYQKENANYSNNMNFKSNETYKYGITQNYNVTPVLEHNKSIGSEFYPNRVPQYPMNNIEHLHSEGQTGQPDVFNMNTQTGGGVSVNLPSSSSLGSLWDKIDNIVKESTTNDSTNTNSNNFVFESTNSQHSYKYLEQALNHNFENTQHFHNTSEQAQIYHNNTSYQSRQPNVLHGNKSSTENPINENKRTPQDIGRGDIGPEELSTVEIASVKTDNVEFNTPPEIRPSYYDNKYNSPEEIDSLSLTKENDNSQNNKLPSDTQEHEDKKLHSENSVSYPTSSITITSTTSKGHEDDTFTNNQVNHKLTENQQFMDEKENSSKSEGSSRNETLSIYTTSTHLDQGPEEIYQHNIHQNVENNEQQKEYNHKNDNINVGQQSQYNIDHQLESFGQQNEQQNQQNVEQELEDYSQQNQQNMEQQLNDFGQQQKQQHFEQQFDSFRQQNNKDDQRNTEQQFVDFGQQNDKLDQQNTEQQIVDFGQQTGKLDQQNTEHQFVDFGQQNDKLDQQNTEQQIVDFGQQTGKLDQQNTEHQFVDFGQQNDKLHQQNTEQQFVDFGQQNDKLDQQNTEQQFVDFGQQHDKLDQQNTEQQFVDFGQQNIGQQLVDLGQQMQTSWNQNKSLKQQDDLDSTGITPINEEKEPLNIVHSVHNLEALPTDDQRKPKLDIESLQEEVTEKPGFWKSVGNKFTGAKDTVLSWFKKS